MRRLSIATLVGLAVSMIASVATAGVLCAAPPLGLQLPQHGVPPLNLDRESITFYYRSQAYPLDLYSAFAQQRGGANFCIRYEVENKGRDSVQKFYWPLATFETENLPPLKRESIVMTQSPGPPPTLEETWVYAFLSGAIKTRAFQKHSELTMPSGSEHRLQIAANARSDLLRLAAVDEAGARRRFWEANQELPQIGAEFSGSDAEVAAISQAKWDGKNYNISIEITRNDNVKEVFAPYAYALYKGVVFESL